MITAKELKEMRGKDRKQGLMAVLADLSDSIVTDPAKLAEFVKKWTGGFHNYSLNNMMLILFQKPDATLLAGYKAWQKAHGRQVQKGARAISILAPRMFKKAEKQDDGTEQIREHVYFKAVNIFDVSDTEGDPINIGCSDMVQGDIDKDLVIKACPYPVSFRDMGLINGATDGKTIIVSPKENDAAMTATLFHEWSHCLLGHATESIRKTLSRADREVEAESTAYAVSTYFGLTHDKAAYYIGGYKHEGGIKPGRGKKVLSVAEKIIRAVEKAQT